MFAFGRSQETLDKKKEEKGGGGGDTHREKERKLEKIKKNTRSSHQFWENFTKIKKGFRMIPLVFCVYLNFDTMFTLTIMN